MQFYQKILEHYTLKMRDLSLLICITGVPTACINITELYYRQTKLSTIIQLLLAVVSNFKRERGK